MINDFKTNCIRFCDTSVLKDTHSWILEQKSIWDNIILDENCIKSYTIDMAYDSDTHVGYMILRFKIYFQDRSTRTIKENIYSITKEDFIKIKDEYLLFKKN